MLEVGSLVDGKYKILSKVGQGGMSVVWMAINEKANKTWAVKEVRKDGVLEFEAVKQGLVAETDILKKLNHKNLPSIIDVIDNEDSFIIIMDYIEGNSLNKALEEYGAQPQEYVIEWAKQLCDVLGYLHSRQPAIIWWFTWIAACNQMKQCSSETIYICSCISLSHSTKLFRCRIPHCT